MSARPESPGFAEAVTILAGARRLVVTTGAGMSRESGIPTFRDAPNALWRDYNPEDLATRDGFRRDPGLVWRWCAERREMIARARPNAGHLALARMAPLYASFLLVTQNIDDLHARAGSQDVVEIHGNIFRYKCFDRDHPAAPPPAPGDAPPRCACGSFLRPDVVWFGEMLNARDLERVYQALEACEAVLVVGTSGLVFPAAGFPAAARSAGARVVEVNPEETPITAMADAFVRGGAADVLPRLLEALRAERGQTD